jgi:hypothetical protein
MMNKLLLTALMLATTGVAFATPTDALAPPTGKAVVALPAASAEAYVNGVIDAKTKILPCSAAKTANWTRATRATTVLDSLKEHKDWQSKPADEAVWEAYDDSCKAPKRSHMKAKKEMKSEPAHSSTSAMNKNTKTS